MSDLECTECGMTASFADASIADWRRTCGAEFGPHNHTERGTAPGGSVHDWREI